LTQAWIIQKIKAIETELAKRKTSNALDNYNTGPIVHQKQILFHACPKRNRWVFGGNRTGKTECGAVEVVYFARGNHPYRKIAGATSGWVVSLSRQVQRDVAQKKILHYLKREWIVDVVMTEGRKGSFEGGVIDYILVKNVFGTISKIGFKSCDQGREKFQGTSLDYVWFDEEPPFDIYTECKMRLLDTCGNMFGTMTPLKGLTWVYNHIYLNQNQDQEIWWQTMQWEDNPFLPKQEVENMTATMSEDELQSRKFGVFGANGGLVYSEFDPSVHVIEPFEVPREWYDTISIDPGLNNPLSAHSYAVDYDGNIFVIAEQIDAREV
jgi:phage terminase large subunit-like protein